MSISYYVVERGDSLSRICEQRYGTKDPAFVKLVTAMNSFIRDPNKIYPGQILALPNSTAPLALSTSDTGALSSLGQTLNGNDPKTNAFLKLLDISSYGEPAMDGMLEIVSKSMSRAETDLKAIVKSYEDYKRGTGTRGQYDNTRRKTIIRQDRNLGIFRPLVHDSRPSNEILRINRTKGAVKTGAYDTAMKSARRLSTLAGAGNVVLNVLDIQEACVSISQTGNQREQEIILVETAGKMLLSGIAVAATVALVATPAGWVGLATLTAVSTLAGAAGEVAGSYGARKLYDVYGDEIDMSKVTKIASSACSAENVAMVRSFPGQLRQMLLGDR
ncbi:hypothetical protein DMC47_08865 [Nostoc sp. 3335mG]|nr:hypothetical protein DMC47_08865 [Nostoc sp. 3335mG]